jgi:hypothetical protein
MALHGNTGHAVTYLAGNIIKAEPGLRAEPGCFLYMPLRIAISESAREPARSASTCQPICSPHSTATTSLLSAASSTARYDAS